MPRRSHQPRRPRKGILRRTRCRYPIRKRQRRAGPSVAAPVASLKRTDVPSGHRVDLRVQVFVSAPSRAEDRVTEDHVRRKCSRRNVDLDRTLCPEERSALEARDASSAGRALVHHSPLGIYWTLVRWSVNLGIDARATQAEPTVVRVATGRSRRRVDSRADGRGMGRGAGCSRARGSGGPAGALVAHVPRSAWPGAAASAV